VGNSKHVHLAPPAEDIALVFLDDHVAGVTPAPVADAEYLAGLDLTSETFTVVGYGVDAFITGSLLSNHPVVLVDGIRSYRDVSVITEHDAFPDRFLKITQSTCFGDSGGPLFHDGTVVAIDTWTFSTRCSAPNLAYPGRIGGSGDVPRGEPLTPLAPRRSGPRCPAGPAPASTCGVHGRLGTRAREPCIS
jgi:hypothetical protein